MVEIPLAFSSVGLLDVSLISMFLNVVSKEGFDMYVLIGTGWGLCAF